MSVILYTFTTQDAEYVLGRALQAGEVERLADALTRGLTHTAADIVLDVGSQVGVQPDPSTTCPRCGHQIPRDELPGEYPGATSRVDNETEICSVCGLDEAMGNGVVPKDKWPIPGWHSTTIAIDEGNAEQINRRLREARKERLQAVPEAEKEGG